MIQPRACQDWDLAVSGIRFRIISASLQVQGSKRGCRGLAHSVGYPWTSGCGFALFRSYGWGFRV